MNRQMFCECKANLSVQFVAKGGFKQLPVIVSTIQTYTTFAFSPSCLSISYFLTFSIHFCRSLDRYSCRTADSTGSSSTDKPCIISTTFYKYQLCCACSCTSPHYLCRGFALQCFSLILSLYACAVWC